jgi:NAD(P)-dependent dehydrogenase (short-subunit alcohol dehydrogenase family)
MDMFKDGLLKGKRILVTGGGTGLGEVMAEAYASSAPRFTSAAGAPACSTKPRRRFPTRPARRSKASPAISAWPKLWTTWSRRSGPMAARSPASSTTRPAISSAARRISRPRGFNAIADIVFRGSFYVTLSCGKRWIEAATKRSVISILTTWIWNGGPFTVPSAMSKAGLNIMTKSLATEWGPNGIRLNAIAPGPFPTKGAWERLIPQSLQSRRARKHDSDGPRRRNAELANLAVFLMSDGCDYLTGQTIAIDGAMHLASGGNFAALSKLGDEDWDRIRGEIRGQREGQGAAGG